MQISNYNSPYKINQANKSNFTSFYQKSFKYIDAYGNIRKTQGSTEKRNDLNYDKLAKIITTRFSDCDNVNIIPMNVSDGTEAYFIFKSLAEEIGLDEFERKYGKIDATDVCEHTISVFPKNGLVALSENEYKDLSINHEPMFEITDETYNTYEEMPYKEGLPIYKLKPKYEKYFNFEIQDLQERLKDLEDDGNSVVIIRNCLRESFGDAEASAIVEKVAKKLKGNSLFITGDFDRGMPTFEQKLRENFVEIDRNIWAKREEEEPAYYRYQDALIARIGKDNFEQTFKDGTSH